MLLEGKVAMTAATLVTAGVIAAWNSLGPWAQDLVLAAAAIAAIKVIGGALRRAFAVAAEVHDAVTSKLPKRVDRLESEVTEMKGSLNVMAQTDRVRVQTALEVARKPRPARASDPEPKPHEDDDRRIWFFEE